MLEFSFDQDYENFEVIVVDDGSTDNSAEIVKELNSDKIKLFSKQNGGPSSARNFGIENCDKQTEWIVFVDSDDTVASNFISSLVKLAHSDSLTICEINGVYSDSNNANHKNTRDEKIDYVSISNFWSDNLFLEILKNGAINSSCNKIYNYSILLDNNLRFKKVLSGRFHFQPKLFAICKKDSFHKESPL